MLSISFHFREHSMKSVLAAVLMLMGVAPLLRAEESAGGGLFHSNCVICHSADGSGNTAIGKQNKIKDLKSPEVQKQSDAELAEIISKGKKPMPPFAGRLKPDQIHEIVEYLRELGKKH